MRAGFDDCVLDGDTRELVCAGEVVPVEPQVFAVLAYLVAHRDRVVAKTELLDEVWGDRFVSESALTTRIKQARRAVGDSGRDQRVIKTVHGHGFRFVAPVEDVAAAPAALSPLSSPTDGDRLTARVLAALAGSRGEAFEVVGGRNATLALLVDAVYEEAAQRGYLVARGSGAGAGLRPYGCVLDAVDELVQRAPELLDRVPATCRDELGVITRGHTPTSRSRLFLAVRELLVAAASTAPMLMVVDEVQYADPDTIALLDHAARVARHHRLVLVAAHAPGVVLDAPYERVDVETDTDAAADGSVAGGFDVPAELVDVLQRVALEGSTFDALAFRAAGPADPVKSDRALDLALRAGVVEFQPGGLTFRFSIPGLADELLTGVAPHRRAALHRELALRLQESGADSARVARHLVAAHEPAAAVPFALDAARQASDGRRAADVLRWTGDVLEHASGDALRELLTLRAAALADTGEPTAVHVYREALALTPPGEAVDVRAGLARAAMLSGDLATAEEALAGVDPDGDGSRAPVVLVRAMLAYFQGDLDAADELLRRARGAALAPGAPARLLDVITLQGLIAHDRGEWFDRLRRELRATRDSPDLAVTVFDGHLCVAEYLLYGPTPYAEVVALARGLEQTAARSGARRAVAFSACIAGEAELLAGDLEGARTDLVRAVTLHRELAADTGTAHSLQRLAEVELASGDPAAATRLLREALVIARWSPASHHLVQRIYGTLIAAAPDRGSALALVDEAAEVLDGPTACEVCQVMVAVPSAIACAEGGRLDEARRHLDIAAWSAAFWQGTAWPGALAEARAALARAEGRADEADGLLEQAAAMFEQAGQPLDAARCRETIGD